MKAFVYVLEYIYYNAEKQHTDLKFLGLFNDVKELERVQDVASKFSGFKDYPNGFVIKKYELDKVHWEIGFYTVVGEIGRDYLPEEDIIDKDTSIAQNLKSIFNISHAYTVDFLTDDERIIGVFSSLNKARHAIELLKEKPGFKEHPEDFIIDEIQLNELLWISGF